LWWEGSQTISLTFILDKITMQLKLQTPEDSTIPFTIPRTSTTTDLNSLVEKHYHIQPADYYLTHASESLLPHQTLFSQHIRHLSLLSLHLHVQQPWVIFVKVSTGKTVTIASSPTMTVDELKTKIKDKTQIPPDQQHLHFNGNQLAEGKEVVSYGMRHESICQQVLRLLGCGCGCAERTADDYFAVQVRTHKGLIVTVALLASDLIELVKEMVEAVGGLPSGCQRLMLEGKILRVGTMVEDYGFGALKIEEVRRVGHRCGVCAPAGGNVSIFSDCGRGY
jgi:hypothetical protein